MLAQTANKIFLCPETLSKLEADPRFNEAAGIIMRSHSVFNEYAPSNEFSYHPASFDAAHAEIVRDVTRAIHRKGLNPDQAIDYALSYTLNRGSEFANKNDVDVFVASVRKNRKTQKSRQNLSLSYR